MKILVYPHAMEIGGSQINAIQIAGAIRDRGHEVIVLSEPGPMVELVRELGLETWKFRCVVVNRPLGYATGAMNSAGPIASRALKGKGQSERNYSCYTNR